MEKELNDKNEKLWKLLEAHSKELERQIQFLKRAIKERAITHVGAIAGTIVVIGQSDVCYAVTLEILEELRQPKGGLAG